MRGTGTISTGVAFVDALKTGRRRTRQPTFDIRAYGASASGRCVERAPLNAWRKSSVLVSEVRSMSSSIANGTLRMAGISGKALLRINHHKDGPGGTSNS